MTIPYQRALRMLSAVLVVYAALVVTHEGEFWPFSIYPMFSRGGHPWVRSIVREVPPTPDDAALWQPVAFETMPGKPYPLNPTGINQNDIANFVSKSDTWDAGRVGAMRKVFGDALTTHTLLILRADGRIAEADSIAVTFTPFILLTPDSTYFNPNLSY